MLTLETVFARQGDFTLEADFTVDAAARVAVTGPSGGGKSTLLNIVAGFLEPDRGRVLWNGAPLTGVAPGKRDMSVLFQDNNLFPHMDISQNAGLGVRADLRLSAGEKTRVAEALERVGLAGLGARKPAALSGGQQSRAALARVLLRSRSLLLLDEPFAALGPALKAEMLELVARLAD
jgi:thiamine transport system ATP-binding protein